MNRYINKKIFILINVFLFIIEVIMVYLVINTFLSNDNITPENMTFYEYLVNKFSNLVQTKLSICIDKLLLKLYDK